MVDKLGQGRRQNHAPKIRRSHPPVQDTHTHTHTHNTQPHFGTQSKDWKKGRDAFTLAKGGTDKKRGPTHDDNNNNNKAFYYQ